MSRVAWFHCFAGVAGDMTMAALVDAGAKRDDIAMALAALDLDGYALTFSPTQRCGVAATLATVVVGSHDGHDHHDEHEHEHRQYRAIRDILQRSDLVPRVRARAERVFHALAEVEAAMHGVAVDEVEFHEVGSTDAIVDVVGACAALESLGVDRITCSPITLGLGTVRMAHGQLPNPAPATVALLARASAPARGADTALETATPTGVALMTALSDSFGPMPAMAVTATGYGAGTADTQGRPNVVQVVIGEASESPATAPAIGQPVRHFEANVDDITGEVVAHTIAALLASGAHDAWAAPIVMKKGRPAYTIHALAGVAEAEAVARVLVAETGTLGLRASTVERWPRQREEIVVDVDGHRVRAKRAAGRVKVEHDDAAAAARSLGRPLRDVIAAAERAANDRHRSDG